MVLQVHGRLLRRCLRSWWWNHKVLLGVRWQHAFVESIQIIRNNQLQAIRAAILTPRDRCQRTCHRSHLRSLKFEWTSSSVVLQIRIHVWVSRRNGISKALTKCIALFTSLIVASGLQLCAVVVNLHCFVSGHFSFFCLSLH